MEKFFSVELAAWNKAQGIFDFNVYRRDASSGEIGDDILASYDVQDGVVYDYSRMEELGVSPDALTASEANGKMYEKVLNHYVCGLIEKARTFKELWESLSPASREDLSWEQEKTLIHKAYELYAKEGFASVFQSPYKENGSRNGQEFSVLSRILLEDEDAHAVDLPMWKIRFADGEEICALPEEIIASEQRSAVN